MIEVEGLTMRAWHRSPMESWLSAHGSKFTYPEFEFSEGKEFTIKAIVSEAEYLRAQS